MKKVDIHSGIDSTLLILQHRLKATKNRPEIRVIKEYGQLPNIECYPSQLNQVFMNILANTIDALEARYMPGIITIKTEIYKKIKIELNHKFFKISISDNGHGIAESVQKIIFAPFFTTKAVGKGTGLWLSISHQIVVEKHRGELKCISNQNRGTLQETGIKLSGTQVRRILKQKNIRLPRGRVALEHRANYTRNKPDRNVSKQSL